MENIQSVGSGFAPQPQGPPSGAMSAAPPQEEHKNHDGKLVLGVLAAGAATVGAIALIKRRKPTDEKKLVEETKKQIEKMKTEVLDPLLKIDKSKPNNEFAQEAYKEIIKSRGLEKAAPTLEIKRPSQEFLGHNAYFDEFTGNFVLSDIGLTQHSRGDIIGLLTHHIDHMEKVGNIAQVKGHQHIADTLNKRIETQVLDTISHHRKEVDKAFADTDANTLRKYIQDISGNRLDPSKKTLVELMEEGTGESVSNMSKDKLKERFLALFPEADNKVSIENLQYIAPGDPMHKEFARKADASFWEKYVTNAGGKKEEKDFAYGIKPFIEEFEAPIAKAPTYKSSFEMYEGGGAKYKKPFAQSANDLQFGVLKEWDELLKAKGEAQAQNIISDPRKPYEVFGKIDEKLKAKFPDKDKRIEEFEKLHEEAFSEAKTGENVLDILLKKLENPTPPASAGA